MQTTTLPQHLGTPFLAHQHAQTASDNAARPTASAAPGHAPAEASAWHTFSAPGQVPSGEPAPLPEPKGPQAPASEVHAAAAAWHDGTVNDFEVYDLLRQAAQKNLVMASTLQRGGQTGVFSARTNEVNHTRDQQRGQAQAAKIDVVGAAVTCGVALVAGALTGVNSTGLMQQLAPTLRELGRPGVQLFNQIHPTGGIYASNQAALALKDDAIAVQAHTTVVDTSRATADQAREELRNVLQLVQGHLQRITDVSDRIAR